jgi:APA family basic amino acid/polyamine antiporter
MAIPHFDISNWFNHNVAFDQTLSGSTSFMPYGIQGIFAGAGVVFFAYNGFDTLASATEESKNPEKDITIAVLSALFGSMILYIIVAGVLVGIVPYNELGNASPFAYALSKIGSNKSSIMVSIGAVAGMTTVLMFQLFAQSRMLFEISKDGLLPSIFSKVHSKFKTPYVATLFAGLLVTIISGFCHISVLFSLSSMSAIISFIFVSIIMLVLRKKLPDARRPFKCPAAYIVAPIAILLCGYLVLSLIPSVGIYFVTWVVFSIVFYIFYSSKHSKLKA